MKKRQIVTIGGGKGQSELLAGLRDSGHTITAIVSVMDSGGSSGVLRKKFAILPPGDLRRCISALSSDVTLTDRWNSRDDNGHAVGNLEIADAIRETGDIHKALKALEKKYRTAGSVLPVTTQLTDLVAEYDDRATVITGETHIDLPQHDPKLHIAGMWLEPAVETTSYVKKAISKADVVVLTMGDLYTSVLPNLLVAGVREAIAQRDPLVVFVCNRSTKQGETHDFSTADFAHQVQKYLDPVQLDVMIIDDGSTPVPSQFQAVRAAELPAEIRTVSVDLSDVSHPEYVSGSKAASAIIELCESL